MAPLKELVHSIARIEKDEQGKPIRVLGVIQDITERKKAEVAIRESEERIRTMIEQSPLSIQVLSPDGLTLQVNHAFLELWGITLEDLTGYNMLRDEQLTRLGIMSYIRRGFSGEVITIPPVQYNTHESLGTGEKKWVLAHIYPVRDSVGSIRNIILVHEDITERKKAEEAVRKSRDYYLKLFDDLPNPIWRSNTSAKCDYFNKEWLAFTGRMLEQETGDGWTEGVHPDDLDRCVKTYLAAFSIREPFEMEYRIRHHDGTYHWLLDIGKPFYDPEGNFAGYIGACYDITRRKTAEGELRESRQMLETLINTIPVRVFWKDKNLTYLGCNIPFAQDAGFNTPEDIIGKDDYSMGWHDQAELYRADDLLVIETGKPRLLIEEPQTTPSGERICLLTSKIPLKDETGDIIGVLGTYLDITVRKQMEEELRRSEEKYRLLIEKTNEGVWMIDKDYRTTFVNNRLAEMFGYSPGEMIGKQAT